MLRENNIWKQMILRGLWNYSGMNDHNHWDQWPQMSGYTVIMKDIKVLWNIAKCVENM